jgi:CRP-like cAMP-binding protein
MRFARIAIVAAGAGQAPMSGKRSGPTGGSTSRAPVVNRLVAALPARGGKRLLAACEPVELTFGEVLNKHASRIRQVYFPLSGFISLLIPVDGHASLEVELVGNEGMLGVPLALGVNTPPLQAVVQGTGTALRLSAVSFRRELQQSPALQRTVSRYICVLLVQLAQSAACIGFHQLDARLARWLLMTHDRAHTDDFRLTHEFLAQMLGVRRVGVTNAAGQFQKRKLVTYSRGDMTVLDRTGLEAAACGCYDAAKATYERILG